RRMPELLAPGETSPKLDARSSSISPSTSDASSSTGSMSSITSSSSVSIEAKGSSSPGESALGSGSVTAGAPILGVVPVGGVTDGRLAIGGLMVGTEPVRGGSGAAARGMPGNTTRPLPPNLGTVGTLPVSGSLDGSGDTPLSPGLRGSLLGSG